MNHAGSFVSALTLLLAGVATAQEKQEPSPAIPEVLAAQARAQVHNKRVLAVLNAEDEDFAAVLKKDRALSRKLLYEFETVSVAGKEADTHAIMWKFPAAVQDKPALVVLDTDGKVLARLERDGFLNGENVDAAKLLPLLEPHFCKPVDADKKLANALVEAKKTGRNVFIRFDAPW